MSLYNTKKAPERKPCMKSREACISPESVYYVYSPSRTARDLFLYPLQCGLFFYEPGYRLSRESYDNYLLMYIEDGQMTLEYEGRTILVKKNCFVLLDCRKKHIYHTSGNCTCLWCHFDGLCAAGYYANILAHLDNPIRLSNPLPVVGKLELILDTFSEGRPVREALMNKYLTDILTAFLLHTPRQAGSSSYAGMAEEIISYINEHFSENITIERLAGIAGMSPYHFIRVFRKETGFTPHEYLVNTRLLTARYLLKNSCMSVKDICFTAGFSSESVFCTAFKKHQGITPAQYRMLK